MSVNVDLFDEFESDGFLLDLAPEVIVDKLFVGGVEAESGKRELVIIHVKIGSSSGSHDQIEQQRN